MGNLHKTVSKGESLDMGSDFVLFYILEIYTLGKTRLKYQTDIFQVDGAWPDK